MLDLTFTNETKNRAFTGSFFERILKVAIKEVSLEKKKVGLSVNLVSKAVIKSLNKKYRGKDKATDVLSFPLTERIDRKAISLELGDIFTSPDVATEKTETSRQSLKQEMQWLVIHGFLHLLGYDHERSKSEEKKMFALQEKILKLF